MRTGVKEAMGGSPVRIPVEAHGAVGGSHATGTIGEAKGGGHTAGMSPVPDTSGPGPNGLQMLRKPNGAGRSS